MRGTRNFRDSPAKIVKKPYRVRHPAIDWTCRIGCRGGNCVCGPDSPDVELTRKHGMFQLAVCGREHRAHKSGAHPVLRTVLPGTSWSLVPQRLTRRRRSGPPAFIQAQLVLRRGLLAGQTKWIRGFRIDRPCAGNRDPEGRCAQHHECWIKRLSCERAGNPYGAAHRVGEGADLDPYRDRVNHFGGKT
jgi:hypothetical protein